MNIDKLKSYAVIVENRLKRRIGLAYEDDDCTDCYRQGMTDALDEIYLLLDEIAAQYRQSFQDSLSNAQPIQKHPDQKPLI